MLSLKFGSFDEHDKQATPIKIKVMETKRNTIAEATIRGQNSESYATLPEVMRSPLDLHQIMPLSIELDGLYTYSSMKPFALIEKFQEPSAEQLKPPTFETDFETGKFGSYSYGGYSIGKPSPVKNFEIEELFLSDEKVAPLSNIPFARDNHGIPAEAETKKSRRGQYPRKKKFVSKPSAMEENDNDKNLKLDRISKQSGCAKQKTGSDQPTDTTLSPHEFHGLNGLAGSTPFFKRSKCSSCRQTTLVFWFGNPTSNARAERFLCACCVKTVAGEEKFSKIIAADRNWNFSLEKEVIASRRSTAAKDSKKHESEKLEESAMILNNYLEVKQIEVNYLMTKMTMCLNAWMPALDTETKLLAIRFVQESLEALMKISHILRLSFFQRKLECLDEIEQTYFRGEISKISSANYYQAPPGQQTIPSRKCSGGDLLQLLNTSRGHHPKKKNSFFLEYDDRPFLGKRDPSKHKLFEEHDEVEGDLPLKELFDDSHSQGLRF